MAVIDKTKLIETNSLSLLSLSKNKREYENEWQNIKWLRLYDLRDSERWLVSIADMFEQV